LVDKELNTQSKTLAV